MCITVSGAHKPRLEERRVCRYADKRQPHCHRQYYDKPQVRSATEKRDRAVRQRDWKCEAASSQYQGVKHHRAPDARHPI